MEKTKSCYKFYFNKCHKSWTKGKAPPAVTYQEYTQDESLCLVRTIEEYIACKGTWRSRKEESQVLLSFSHPHKPVVSSTVSGWLKAIIMKSSVDTGTLKTHSTRSASNLLNVDEGQIF